MKVSHNQPSAFEDFEQMVVQELERLKETRTTASKEVSPLRKNSYQNFAEQDHHKKSPLGKGRQVSEFMKGGKTPLTEKQLNRQNGSSKPPVFEAGDYCEFKHLEKEAKKSVKKKQALLGRTHTPNRVKKQPKSQIDSPIFNIKFEQESTDMEKENIGSLNMESTQAEIEIHSKIDSKKPASTSVKKVKKPRGFEDYSHQPNLSKTSLLIASNMGSAFERLTSKSKSIKKKVKREQEEDPSFRPKINSRSLIMVQSSKSRGCNRFLELHEEAQKLETKKENQRIQNERAKEARESRECAFQPRLVSNYSPDYLGEMDFLQRSYMWKKRIEQKLENQRKAKDESQLFEHVTELGSTVKPLEYNPSYKQTQKETEMQADNSNNVSQELAQFFNLKGDKSVQQRKLNNKYLY